MTARPVRRAWLFGAGLALLAGLPSCSEYSVCDKHPGDCQLAPQTSSETIFLWESQALRVEPNPSGEAADEQSRRTRTYFYDAELTTPSQMQPLKQWQNLGMDGEAQTALTLMLAEADQQAWQVLLPMGALGAELKLTQQTTIGGVPQLVASGNTRLTLKAQALTLTAPAFFAQDTSLDKSPGGAAECAATTAQLGIVHQEIWALVPRYDMSNRQCKKTWRGCKVEGQALKCYEKTVPGVRDEFTVEPHESLASFAPLSRGMPQKPLLWVQRERGAAGVFVPALCGLDSLVMGCDVYLEGNTRLQLDAHAVAVSQDGSFAALLQKNGTVQKRRLTTEFPAAETGLTLAPVSGGPGYIAAARLSAKQGPREVIVAAWGGQLGLASGTVDGAPRWDEAASTALTSGFAAIAGTGATVSGLALGDVDGDEQLDLVVAYGAQIYVALGRGFPTFSWTSKPELGRKISLPDTTNDLISAVAIGDLNGDGKADLAAVSRSSQKFFALLAK